MQDAPYRELQDAWKAMRATHALTVREVACVGAPRTLLCVEIGAEAAPLVTVATGIHGDEHQGPRGLLQLVERRLLDDRYRYRLWPCVNPTGYDGRTRENAEGTDIRRTFGRGGASPEAKAIVMANRDLKFALAVELHPPCAHLRGDSEGLTFTELLRRNAAARVADCGGVVALLAEIASLRE